MSWKVTCVMDEKMRFVLRAKEKECSRAELCRQFGISRKTGYKWIDRYEKEGPPGLADQSRRPAHTPTVVSKKTEQVLVRLRQKHPTWGAKKLLVLFKQNHPDLPPCARSTAQDILKRNGLVKERRGKRNKATPNAQPLQHCQAINQVWCVDFKGAIYTSDGAKCEPLTITDAFSRLLFRCQNLSANNTEHTRAVFETLFRECGLPERIRSDNGVPMATVGLCGLSKLSVWWMRLGIHVERIRPGKPQENGRHERMHRTLKAETANPPQATLREQQAAFDRFRYEYNNQRPHEALGMQTPASLYQPSPRTYPARLAPVVYPEDWRTRNVRTNGSMKWNGREVRITTALAGETLGLKWREAGRWEVYFMTLLLGVFDEEKMRLEEAEPIKPAQAETQA